jgi:hypothetical protein
MTFRTRPGATVAILTSRKESITGLPKLRNKIIQVLVE